MKNIVNEGNIVSTSARGCIVNGVNNYVGYACKSIILSGCTRCVVVPKTQNVTLINCTDLTITQSNVTYVNNIIQNTEPILTKKIFLKDELNTLYSNPIDTGITVTTNQFIEVISASIKWNAGTTPFFSFSYLSLITDTATYGWYPTISDYSLSQFKPFVFDQSVGVDLIENKSLLITADADSTNGNGSATIYINYKVTTL